MFQTGYLRLGRIKGVPVRLHFSVAIGALLFSGFRFAPAFWLAFPLLVLVHEFGHALLVQRLGHRALAVDVTGFGGLCHWDARFASRLDHAIVAWGGVLAQALLLLAALAYLAVRGAPLYAWEAEALHVFTSTNLWLIALNLLPIPPLDGARAWTVFREWRRAGGRWPKPRKVPSNVSRRDLAQIFERAAEEARNARR